MSEIPTAQEEEAPRCTCYRGNDPQQEGDQCPYCEAKQEEELIPESHLEGGGDHEKPN